MNYPNPSTKNTQATQNAGVFKGDHSNNDSEYLRNKEFIRAEREDDDGYDPYSDRIEITPLFERDPWR